MVLKNYHSVKSTLPQSQQGLSIKSSQREMVMMFLLCPPPVNSDQSHDRLKADISVCVLSVFQCNLLSRSAKP